MKNKREEKEEGGNGTVKGGNGEFRKPRLGQLTQSVREAKMGDISQHENVRLQRDGI